MIAMSVKPSPHYAHHLHNYITANVYADASTGPCSFAIRRVRAAQLPCHAHIPKHHLVPSVPDPVTLQYSIRCVHIHNNKAQVVASTGKLSRAPTFQRQSLGQPGRLSPNLVPNALGFNLSHSMQERGNNTYREETASIHSGYGPLWHDGFHLGNPNPGAFFPCTAQWLCTEFPHTVHRREQKASTLRAMRCPSPDMRRVEK